MLDVLNAPQRRPVQDRLHHVLAMRAPRATGGRMRTADNSIGYDVEMHTSDGWVPTAPAPHQSRQEANADLANLKAALPAHEFRVYEAVKGRT